MNPSASLPIDGNPDPRRNGKRGTLIVASLSLALLAGAGVALKDRLLESWYLHELEHGDFEAQKEAANKLGRLCSARAVPLLVRLLETRPARPDVHSGEDPTVYLVLEPAILEGRGDELAQDLFDRWPPPDTYLPLYRESAELVRALSLINTVKPGAVVPHLEKLLLDEDPYRSRIAAALLRYAGSRATGAVPALIKALRLQRPQLCWDDTDEAPCHRLIAAALGRIGRAAMEAVPVLTEILSDGKRRHLREAAAQALKEIQGTEPLSGWEDELHRSRGAPGRPLPEGSPPVLRRSTGADSADAEDDGSLGLADSIFRLCGGLLLPPRGGCGVERRENAHQEPPSQAARLLCWT
ncbi:MAG: HEAT repeat domain-containing protein [Planctomycetes bacterium]|nr:HEAT repeat domain-containing protein [Planctomycetota bacterium]